MTGTTARDAGASLTRGSSRRHAPRHLAPRAGRPWRRRVAEAGPAPQEAQRSPGRLPAWLRGLLVGTELGLGLLIVGAILLMSVVPAVKGWVPLAVLTGSMEPAISPGSMAVVAPVTGEEARHLSIGTVVSYLPQAGSDVMVTHRVVGIQAQDDGSSRYVVQGDANVAPDQGLVHPRQVRGVLRYHVPFLGRLLALLGPQVKQVGRVLAIASLLGYALWQLIGGLREHGARARRQGEAPSG